MLGRRSGTIPSRGPLATLPGARRLSRSPGATTSPTLPLPAFIVPATVLPSPPNAARAALQPAPSPAAVLAAAPARAARPRPGAVAQQDAQVRAVRAAGPGVRVRASGPAGEEPELVPGAAAARLAPRARRVRRPPARRAHVHDHRDPPRVRSQEHRAHGQRSRRRDAGLTRVYIECIYISSRAGASFCIVPILFFCRVLFGSIVMFVNS